VKGQGRILGQNRASCQGRVKLSAGAVSGLFIERENSERCSRKVLHNSFGGDDSEGGLPSNQNFRKQKSQKKTKSQQPHNVWKNNIKWEYLGCEFLQGFYRVN